MYNFKVSARSLYFSWNKQNVWLRFLILQKAVFQLALNGGLPLFPSAATALLKLPLSYFNSRHKTVHFDENFMKIGPKLKNLSIFKSQFYVYSIFEVFIVEWDYIL